jgi:TetR/AcrR family transcriptional repressor of nem operon
MRRSRSATAESKRRVVTAAARLMRECGPDGVSVAEVMGAAGMTHGGFYSHFPAKDALLAAATEQAFAEKLDPIEAAPAGAARHEALLRYLDAYLSMGHVTTPGAGCPIAGLAPELGRAAPEVRAAMAGGVRRMLETLAAAAPADGDPRGRAISMLASAVGAIVLARAVADPELAGDIIKAVRNSTRLTQVLPKAENSRG